MGDQSNRGGGVGQGNPDEAGVLVAPEGTTVVDVIEGMRILPSYPENRRIIEADRLPPGVCDTAKYIIYSLLGESDGVVNRNMWVALTPRDVSPLKKPEDDVLTGVKTSFSILAGQDTAEGIRYDPALEATLRDFIELIDNPALSDEDIQQMLSMLGFEYRRGGLEDIKNEPRNPTYTPIPPSLEILSWRLVQLACLNLPEEEIFGLPDRLLREEDPNSESAESARTDLHNPDFYTHPSQRRLQQNLQVILDYWRSRAFSILEE